MRMVFKIDSYSARNGIQLNKTLQMIRERANSTEFKYFGVI